MYGGDVVRNRLELLFRQRKLLRNAARTVVQQIAEGLDDSVGSTGTLLIDLRCCRSDRRLLCRGYKLYVTYFSH